MSWNIQHLEPYAEGCEPHQELDRALADLRPDILLLQEVDRHQQRSGGGDQTALSADLLGATAHYFRPTPEAPGNYCIAIVSTLPVIRWHQKSLRRSPIGMRLTFMVQGKPETFYCADHERAVLAAELENGWFVANMHASFVPGWSHLMVWRAARWARKEAKRAGCNLLLCGDFNFSSHAFLKLIGLRSLNVGVTFPTWTPERQIDFIAVDKHNSAKANTVDVRPYGISDHCAVVVDF